MGLLEDSIPDRYENNPLLAVLENYVLDAIGKLDPDKAALLNHMLTKTFGGSDWKKIIRAQFDLPPDTDQSLQQLWKQAQEQATLEQKDLTPEQFAQSTVDDLFTNLGGA